MSPFCFETDTFFEPALVGAWVVPYPQNPMGWRIGTDGKGTYSLIMVRGLGNEEVFGSAQLFRLGGRHTFAGIARTARCLDEETFQEKYGKHTVLRILSVEPTVKYTMLDPGWLRSFLKENPEAIPHRLTPGGPNQSGLVLTADTAELQRFLLKHVDTEEAWTAVTELTRMTPVAAK